MEEEKKFALRRKLNMKLYPLYRMMAADILFFNAIKVLFLTQVKGFSNAEVVFMETIYAFCKMTFQIPISVIISKLGIRKSIIIGNVFWILEVFLIMISQNYAMIILSQLCSSIGWGLKTAEAPLLTKSIPESRSKGKIFTKLDSKGYSRYCYFSAIATILSGFLYEINPYIPVLLAIFFMGIALVLSLNFTDIQKQDNKTIKESIREVKEGFGFIIKSPRLKSLIIMMGFIWGMFCLFGTYQTTLLKDINVPAKYIGIILAILEIMQGIAATKANEFNKKHKNKTLTYIALRMTIGAIIAGGVVVIGLPRIPMLAIIIFTNIIRMSDKGIYKIIKRRYIGNFMTPEILTKVYCIDSVITSIMRMTISAFGSFLLTIINIQYAMVAIGMICTVITFMMYKFTKTKVGLKPEEYTKKDIVKI